MVPKLIAYGKVRFCRLIGKSLGLAENPTVLGDQALSYGLQRSRCQFIDDAVILQSHWSLLRV